MKTTDPQDWCLGEEIGREESIFDNGRFSTIRLIVDNKSIFDERKRDRILTRVKLEKVEFKFD